MTHRQSSECNGYLTVYLSLSLTIILSLIMTLFQGAKLGAVGMKAELVTDIAMNSVLGEYNIPLFEKYGLLFIDDSFGEKSGNIQKVEEHLRTYFNKNFELSSGGFLSRRTTMMKTTLTDVKVTGYSLSSDNEGQVLKRQILAYMGNDVLNIAFKKAKENVDILESNDLSERNIEDEARINEGEASGSYFADKDGDGENEEYVIDNPVANVSAQKSIGILALAAPDLSGISSKSVDPSKYISHRRRQKGTGLDESYESGATGELLFNQYLFEKCGYFGHENEDSPLSYEIEYLIGGKGNDYKNLESVVNQLFLWKEAANFAYIMSDEAKLAQAEALALTASVLLTVPELKEVLKMAVIFAWSFAETISDLRILLTGGKVPLIKTAASWNLSIENMQNFRENLREGGGTGLKYSDYLRMMILMKEKNQVALRLMDIMEMNIRKTEGYSRFKMDNCIDVYRARFTIPWVFGRNTDIERIYGYEM